MTAYTLGEAGALALARIGCRAGALPSPGETAPHPVLRGSREAGTFEDAFFVAPAKGETDHLLRVARRALDAGRMLRRVARRSERVLSASERLVTQLSAGAVRVLEELLTLSRLNQGRVYPSYDHLARVTGLGRATVARGLRLLEEIGFLVRQRRFARLGTNGAGPRIAQTSNAYRLTLPREIIAHLPRWLRPAPIPDDEAQRLATHDTEQKAMRRSLSCRELALATLDGPLGRMLAKLGAGIDARDDAGSAPNASLTLIRNPSLNHLSSAEGYGAKQRVEPRLDQPSKTWHLRDTETLPHQADVDWCVRVQKCHTQRVSLPRCTLLRRDHPNRR